MHEPQFETIMDRTMQEAKTKNSSNDCFHLLQHSTGDPIAWSSRTVYRAINEVYKQFNSQPVRITITFKYI